MVRPVLRRRGETREHPVSIPTDRKVVLHVGCGRPHEESLHPRFRGPDWHELRLDIDPEVQPDVVASIVDMSKVPSDSVDAIWSSHNLEHVYAHEVPLVLRGFFRVLRPGGEILITLPDLQAVAKYVSSGNLEETVYVSPAGPISSLDMIFGHGASVRGGNDFMAHRTGFSARTLGSKLREAGFVDVEVKRKSLALWGEGHKPEHGSVS